MRALERGDRLGHRQVFAEREDVRVHDAAGGALGVVEQALDLARLAAPHQLEHLVGQLLGQVIDQRRGVVGGDLLHQLGDLLGRAAGQQRRAALGAQLAGALHRQLGLAIDQHREGGLALALEQLAEDLAEVGRMLLLEQVQQVGGGADPQQALDGVEHDVNSSLRCHDSDVSLEAANAQG